MGGSKFLSRAPIAFVPLPSHPRREEPFLGLLSRRRGRLGRRRGWARGAMTLHELGGNAEQQAARERADLRVRVLLQGRNRGAVLRRDAC